MKKRNIMVSVIVSILALAISSCSTQFNGDESEIQTSTNSLQNPMKSYTDLSKVRVMHVKTATVGGVNPYKIKIYIEADKLSSTQNVVVHYTDSMTTLGWRDIAAVYAGDISTSKQCWVAEIDFKSPGYSSFDLNVTFALKLTANGQTYWNSNNGANYKTAIAGLYNYATPHYLLINRNVALNNANTAKGNFSGTILVKNLTFTKNVKVTYTTNNWVTTKTVAAVYAENNGVGDEKWSFNTAIPVTATKVQYAVSFTDGNGNVHWDNNLTKNYTMVIPQALF